MFIVAVLAVVNSGEWSARIFKRVAQNFRRIKGDLGFGRSHEKCGFHIKLVSMREPHNLQAYLY